MYVQLIYTKYDEVGIVLFGTKGAYFDPYDDAKLQSAMFTLCLLSCRWYKVLIALKQ